ncbi:MAG: hypothetical protein AB8C84_03610 [Oligoflexales bacterium]
MIQYDELNKFRPQVSMDGCTMTVDHQNLTILGKPYLIRLLNLFVESDHHVLTKTELVKVIYFPNTEVSSRYANHARTNLVKLLSRTRHLLSEAYPDWDWLPYDDDKESWHLYRLPFFKQC